jgi:hypothetical protein
MSRDFIQFALASRGRQFERRSQVHVVNGLTGMGLGSRCDGEWQKRLVKVEQEDAVNAQH